MDDVLCEALYGIEFDPLYSEIESILAQFDMPANPLAGPDEVTPIIWNQISEQTETLLSRCLDLRVFLWHARARLHCEGLCGFFQAIVQLDKLTSNNSKELYPRSEEGGDSGDHAAALGWLSTSRCLAELRTACIIRDQPYRLCDLLITGEQEKGFTSVTAALLAVNSTLQQTGLPDISQQLQLMNIALMNIETYASDCSEDYQLNCQALRLFLTRSAAQLKQPAPPDSAPEQGAPEKDLLALPPPQTDKEMTVAVDTRQDVILLLERILHYFQRHEPSHPAPILIRRTKQLIGMDFISIIEDLLPGSVDALQQFTGK